MDDINPDLNYNLPNLDNPNPKPVLYVRPPKFLPPSPSPIPNPPRN